MKFRIWCLLALVALTGCAAGTVSEEASDSETPDQVAEAEAPLKVKPAATATSWENEAAAPGVTPGEFMCTSCGPSPQPWQERPAMDPAR
ncbi:hypothetical protein AKJ09_10837 [Labilithrix luteola]|uniref:Lipoprotein n=1 Tax=Labilithrix luteola TaxID=1391654 RepID=A0A0K1QEI9_9BACT|nr:hypothetical protein [Labilithrix luteola]AKV04174.1 hypothetical protein AKJ09_10837 [Labilithrix luteola]